MFCDFNEPPLTGGRLVLTIKYWNTVAGQWSETRMGRLNKKWLIGWGLALSVSHSVTPAVLVTNLAWS